MPSLVASGGGYKNVLQPSPESGIQLISSFGGHSYFLGILGDGLMGSGSEESGSGSRGSALLIARTVRIREEV